jgi:4-amino-4-deoxy-L-arabinose transferase-like glycosyltransferase
MVGRSALLAGRRRPTRFALGLALLAIAGLGIRLFYALAVVGRDPLIGDALEFHLLANYLADGHGYVQALRFRDSGVAWPTAFKPPLYPFVLAVVSWFGGEGYVAHHLITCVLGTGTVLLVGLLGRRAGGETTGLVAAGLAAVYPMLVVIDGSLRSESLFALTTALALLAAYRLHDAPGRGPALLFGLAVGAAALTRGEGVLLLALPGLPLAWRAGPQLRRRLRLVVAIGAGFLVVVGPWVARNWIHFDRPLVLSTNLGDVIAGANCDQTYSGEFRGLYSFECVKIRTERNEAAVSERLRRRGLRYARRHADGLPAVMAARLGRTWDLYRPRQQAHLSRFWEKRNLRWQEAGVASGYLLVLLAVVGVVTLRRRGDPVLILISPIVMVSVSSVLFYGFTRFRAPADVALPVLAAVALARAGEIARARRRGRSDPPPAPAPGA